MTLSRQEIVEHINHVLVDEFEIIPETIAPEKRLRDDLELDSLDAVDMIVAIEQRLQIRVNEEEAKEITTVGDVYDFVARMLAAKPASPQNTSAA